MKSLPAYTAILNVAQHNADKHSCSSSESDEPPSKKKVGIVHLVVQSPKTVYQPEPEPDQHKSPTSETFSEVVEDITKQPDEPEAILLSDSDT